MPPNLDGLQPPLRAALVAASDDLRRQGILLDSHITSGYRRQADQERLYADRFSNPNPVAVPGHSPHERGLAVDISAVGWGDEQWKIVDDTLHRHGLWRPYPNDPVHWQLQNPGQAAPPQLPPGQGAPPIFPQIDIKYQPKQPDQSAPENAQYPEDGTMIPMASTMLSAAGYRGDTKELICEFVKTGRVYTYFGVPEDTWIGLMQAGSKGSFMRTQVINIYPF